MYQFVKMYCLALAFVVCIVTYMAVDSIRFEIRLARARRKMRRMMEHAA